MICVAASTAAYADVACTRDRDADSRHRLLAAAGAPNIIPGSMGTHSYHVTGRGATAALASSSHGAGRRWSRGAARARVGRRDLARQLGDVWIDPRLAGRLGEEAPTAYKDLDAVMRAQRDLVRIVRRLRPVLCHKGV